MPLPKSRWREGFVKGFGLFGDGGPGEGFDGALAAGVAEGFLFGWVGHDFVDAVGEVAGEFFSIHRFERAFGHLFDRDEVAGFAVDYDFGDAADGAGHDGASAGHGFKVDDAEGFVDGGANEDAGVAVEFDLGFIIAKRGKRGQSRVLTHFKKSEKFGVWPDNCESNTPGQFTM